uniref:Uncharacterized protein n=1 Tax=Davidia involucrata TaxID=16924 RepID=A0A5B7BTZ0_DAVIN
MVMVHGGLKMEESSLDFWNCTWRMVTQKDGNINFTRKSFCWVPGLQESASSGNCSLLILIVRAITHNVTLIFIFYTAHMRPSFNTDVEIFFGFGDLWLFRVEHLMY